MIDPNRISPKLQERLSALLARHEGDFASAGAALRSGFAAGHGKQLADELRGLVRELEIAEEREGLEHARALREHLQRRGAVTADQSLEALAEPYVNPGKAKR